MEIFVLVLTLSTQYPLLGIAAAVAAILCLLCEDDDEDEGGHN